MTWDLRLPATIAIDEQADPPTAEPRGVMAAPGEYMVTLSKLVDGQTTDLSLPIPFQVKRMRKGALKGTDPEITAEFWQQIAQAQRNISAVSLALRKAQKKVDALHIAILRTPAAPGELDKQLHDIKQKLFVLDEKLNGNRSKQTIGEKNNPTINNRLRVAMSGTMSSTYGPTPTHRRSLEIATAQLGEFKTILENILNDQLPSLEKALQDAGAPWIEGQSIPKL